MSDKISLADYRASTATTRGEAHDYKADFLSQLALAGLPAPDREIVFALPRKWRWDFAFERERVAVEYQGGIFSKGKSGHSNVSGLRRDYEKFTEGALRGWLIVLIDAASVQSGKALEWVERALRLRAGRADETAFSWKTFHEIRCPAIERLYADLQYSHNGRPVLAILPACFGVASLDQIAPKKLLSWLKQMRIPTDSPAYKYVERYAK